MSLRYIGPVIKCTRWWLHTNPSKLYCVQNPIGQLLRQYFVVVFFFFFIILQKEIYKLSVILSMPYLGSEMPLGAGQTFTVVYYLCKGARKKKETKVKSLNLYLIKCNNQLHRVGWEPVGSIADYSCLFIHYWHFWCWLWKLIITKTIL